MKADLRPFILALLVASGSAAPAEMGPVDAGSSGAGPDPMLERYGAARARQDWPGAAAAMREALASSPDNPNYHNLYAYALRRGANPDMALVFRHYNEALRLDPEHREAHEYLGEAYLMVGNLAKAKEHLGVLDRLCTFGCREYRDLKQEIAEFEARGRR
jgi:cytochrome c-type biogenesis protein CcmH/NrfG